MVPLECTGAHGNGPAARGCGDRRGVAEGRKAGVRARPAERRQPRDVDVADLSKRLIFSRLYGGCMVAQRRGMFDVADLPVWVVVVHVGDLVLGRGHLGSAGSEHEGARTELI